MTKISVNEVGVAQDCIAALDTKGNPLPVGEYEVELVWQYKLKTGSVPFRNASSLAYELNKDFNVFKIAAGNLADVREVYIASVAPQPKLTMEEFKKIIEDEYLNAPSVVKKEVTEDEYRFLSEENKALYTKQYYRDENLSVHGERIYIKCDEATYNRHNHPYRKLAYKLIAPQAVNNNEIHENIKRFTQITLPTDSEVEKWYEEAISQECSASSAIYLFRVYLKERLKRTQSLSVNKQPEKEVSKKRFNNQSGDTICQICDSDNPAWYAENELFNHVNGEAREGGVYCPVCFMKMAKDKGIEVIFKCITTVQDNINLGNQPEKEVDTIEQAAEKYGAEYYKKDKPANTYTFHEGFKSGANHIKQTLKQKGIDYDSL